MERERIATSQRVGHMSECVCVWAMQLYGRGHSESGLGLN